MAREIEYAALVAQAEKAVAGVKDPELKRIAFQKVLDDLMGSPVAVSPVQQQRVTKRKAPAAAKARGRRSGPQAYVDELAGETFFRKPKTLANVKAELENRGHHIPLTSLSGPLQKLCQRRVLRRQKIKAGGKETFAYSNW